MTHCATITQKKFRTRSSKLGLWAVDHHYDESVRFGLPSNDAPQIGASQIQSHNHKLSPAKSLDKTSSNAVLQFNKISTSSHLVNTKAVTGP